MQTSGTPGHPTDEQGVETDSLALYGDWRRRANDAGTVVSRITAGGPVRLIRAMGSVMIPGPIGAAPSSSYRLVDSVTKFLDT